MNILKNVEGEGFKIFHISPSPPSFFFLSTSKMDPFSVRYSAQLPTSPPQPPTTKRVESDSIRSHKRTKVIVIVICIVTGILLIAALIMIIIAQHNKSVMFKPYQRGPLPDQVGDAKYIGGKSNNTGAPLATAPSKPSDPNVAILGKPEDAKLDDTKKAAIQKQIEFFQKNPNGCATPDKCEY